MSRKKSRPAAPASTAVIPGPSRAVTPAAAAKPASAPPPAPSFRDTLLAESLRRLFRIAASLQLAIVLLSLFTSCLILATYLESWYNANIARELIYGTWWFILLLFLLATNILCAALKKYPWKKHQTGFLITHTGLLVLCFGGLLDCVRSNEGQIMGSDAKSADAQARGLSNRSGIIYLYNTHQLEFLQLTPDAHKDKKFLEAAAVLANLRGRDDLTPGQIAYLGDNYNTFQLSPGSFPWYADEDFTPNLPLGVRLLKGLAAPLPSFDRDLNNQVHFSVKNYYPHTEVWPVRKPDGGKHLTFPALRIRLKSPMTGNRPSDLWVAGVPSLTQARGPLGLDLMATNEPAFVEVFKNPPAPNDPNMGKDGQLIVAVGSGPGQKLFRVPVDRDNLAHQELGNLGLRLRIEDWGHITKFAHHDKHGGAKERPPEEYPTVKVEVKGGRRGGAATYLACARTPGTAGQVAGMLEEKVALWYHPADFRWGKSGLMGAIQFLKGPKDKVYYRAYGKDGLRQPGVEIDPNDPEAVVRPKFKMPLTFQVSAYLPEAMEGETLVPRNYPLGVDPPASLQPGLRFTLTVNGKSEEFWVRMGTRTPPIEAFGKRYLVRYRPATLDAGFQVQFNRVVEVKDEGSDRPAWFESDVTIFQEKNGKEESSHHRLYMNHTADVGKYRLFQANFEPLSDEEGRIEDDEHGLGALMATGPIGRLLIKPRPVNKSGLAVKYDPGLIISARDWMYAGSTIVVLGIATMFYMRAYFFKPRGGRREPTPEDLPPATVS